MGIPLAIVLIYPDILNSIAGFFLYPFLGVFLFVTLFFFIYPAIFTLFVVSLNSTGWKRWPIASALFLFLLWGVPFILNFNTNLEIKRLIKNDIENYFPIKSLNDFGLVLYPINPNAKFICNESCEDLLKNNTIKSISVSGTRSSIANGTVNQKATLYSFNKENEYCLDLKGSSLNLKENECITSDITNHQQADYIVYYYKNYIKSDVSDNIKYRRLQIFQNKDQDLILVYQKTEVKAKVFISPLMLGFEGKYGDDLRLIINKKFKLFNELYEDVENNTFLEKLRKVTEGIDVNE